MISSAIKRSILRWVHLIFTIPILGYVYSPFEELPNYAPVVRLVFVPVLIFRDSGCTQVHSSPSLASHYGWVHITYLDMGQLS
jgi:hypothetical protein